MVLIKLPKITTVWNTSRPLNSHSLSSCRLRRITSLPVAVKSMHTLLWNTLRCNSSLCIQSFLISPNTAGISMFTQSFLNHKTLDQSPRTFRSSHGLKLPLHLINLLLTDTLSWRTLRVVSDLASIKQRLEVRRNQRRAPMLSHQKFSRTVQYSLPRNIQNSKRNVWPSCKASNLTRTIKLLETT